MQESKQEVTKVVSLAQYDEKNTNNQIRIHVKVALVPFRMQISI